MSHQNSNPARLTKVDRPLDGNASEKQSHMFEVRPASTSSEDSMAPVTPAVRPLHAASDFGRRSLLCGGFRGVFRGLYAAGFLDARAAWMCVSAFLLDASARRAAKLPHLLGGCVDSEPPFVWTSLHPADQTLRDGRNCPPPSIQFQTASAATADVLA